MAFSVRPLSRVAGYLLPDRPKALAKDCLQRLPVLAYSSYKHSVWQTRLSGCRMATNRPLYASLGLGAPVIGEALVIQNLAAWRKTDGSIELLLSLRRNS